jgi:hypothetical protein
MRKSTCSFGAAAGFLALLLAIFGISAWADSASNVQPAATGISTLPLAAQFSISTALGCALPGYRVRVRGVAFRALNARQKFGCLTPPVLQRCGYVFVKPSAGWATTANFNAELVPSQGTSFGEGGMSAPISGNTVVAGAEGATVGSNGYQGAVHVFVKPAGGWVKRLSSIATLTASDGQVGDRLGNAVAVSGNTVVGGAYQNRTAQGAAYVFVEPASGWASMTQTAKLTASDGAAYDWFGYSVAIAGNDVVVGASDANNYQGAAYVYIKPPSGWTTTSKFAAKLVALDGAAEDVFGSSVAISGNTVAVGSDGWPGGNGQGAAYVFGP